MVLFDNISMNAFIDDLYRLRDEWIAMKLWTDRVEELYDDVGLELEEFKKEKEVAVYVPAGQSIRCTWRPKDYNEEKP